MAQQTCTLTAQMELDTSAAAELSVQLLGAARPEGGKAENAAEGFRQMQVPHRKQCERGGR